MDIKFEKVGCQFCKDAELTVIYDQIPDRFNKGRFYRMLRCEGCGFCFLSPRPTETASSAYYDLEDYKPHHLSQKSLFDRIYKGVRRHNSINKRRMIEKIRKAGRLLDIGCGTGEFLYEMKMHQWHVTGMETAPKARQQAGRYELTIFSSLEEITGKFDVITMWHVLEHIHRLDYLADNLNRLLTSNGYLILAVPNLESFDARYFGSYWVALDAPRHLYHFRPQDIMRLFKQWGFELKQISSLLYFDPWYNAILSAKLKGTVKKRSGLLMLLEAVSIGKISFFRGIISPIKAASPVYIARRKGENSRE